MVDLNPIDDQYRSDLCEGRLQALAYRRHVFTTPRATEAPRLYREDPILEPAPTSTEPSKAPRHSWRWFSGRKIHTGAVCGQSGTSAAAQY